jgi:hypothetical protein
VVADRYSVIVGEIPPGVNGVSWKAAVFGTGFCRISLVKPWEMVYNGKIIKYL